MISQRSSKLYHSMISDHEASTRSTCRKHHLQSRMITNIHFEFPAQDTETQSIVKWAIPGASCS